MRRTLLAMLGVVAVGCGAGEADLYRDTVQGVYDVTINHMMPGRISVDYYDTNKIFNRFITFDNQQTWTRDIMQVTELTGDASLFRVTLTALATSGTVTAGAIERYQFVNRTTGTCAPAALREGVRSLPCFGIYLATSNPNDANIVHPLYHKCGTDAANPSICPDRTVPTPTIKTQP